MKKVIALLMVVALSLAAAGSSGRAPDNALVSDVQVSPAADDVSAPTPEDALVDASVEVPVATPTEAPVDAPGLEQRIFNIGISIYTFDDYFMNLCRHEMEKYFNAMESYAVKYNVTVVDAMGDQAVQNDQVDEFIAQGVDVMIINLVQSSSANTVTERAKAADIPVVYINREPNGDDMTAWDNICYVGVETLLKQQGIRMGEIICDLPDRGDADGDGVVRYVMITGEPDNNDGFRTVSSIMALNDAGIKSEQLLQVQGYWNQEKARELAADALAQFGAMIDVIFCNDDYMALGALQAIKDAGRSVGEDIYLVGIDATPEAVYAIIAGDMTGTVRNCPMRQAHAAVSAAIRYAYGERNDTYNWIELVKVTADNATNYIK